MKRFWLLASAVALAMGLIGCGTANVAVSESVLPEQKADSGSSQTATAEQPETKEDAQMKIKITVGDTVLYATLEDNATTRAWTAQMPLTLPMSDLYGREMCYRYGGGAMPTDSLRYDGYKVGDIAYWPPRGSLVILYAQNGEEFERQHLGHIDSGVEVFESTGDADVTFELAD